MDIFGIVGLIGEALGGLAVLYIFWRLFKTLTRRKPKEVESPTTP